MVSLNPIQWLIDLRNRADYGLRQRIAWRWNGLAFTNQPKEGLFRHLPEEKRKKTEARASDLIRKYHFSAFRDASPVDNYLENLYYLDLLEKALEAAGEKLPSDIEAADIGCSSWFYVQALFALLSWWDCPSERQVSLTGYEADAYRVYAGFHSRADHARAHLRGLREAVYLPQAFQADPGRFDLITMLFPFVFIKDHLQWGLPARMFDPVVLLSAASASLKPGGLLVIVNQGEEEHREQRRMLEGQGLAVLAACRHNPYFYSYDIDRFVLVSSHEQQ